MKLEVCDICRKTLRYNGKEYMSVRAASRAEGRAQATIKKHGGVMQ